MLGFGDVVKILTNKRGNMSCGTIGIVTRVHFPENADQCMTYRVETDDYFCDFMESELTLIRKHNSTNEENDELYKKGFGDCWDFIKKIDNLDAHTKNRIFKNCTTSITSIINNHEPLEAIAKYDEWVKENTIKPGDVAVHDGIRFFVTYVDDHKIQGFSLCGGGMMSVPCKMTKKIQGLDCSKELAFLLDLAKGE